MIDCRILEEDEAFYKLFGYTDSKEGTVTRGLFEQLQGGTAFFESFDSLTENVQREVVQAERCSCIRRVGNVNSVPIETPRIICSIEIKADHVVRDEPFLSDTILTNDPYIIGQPPLRRRREDIPSLIHTFLDKQFSNRRLTSAKSVSPEVMYLCIRYDWPGNVKQLKNAIEHAAITSESTVIHPADLPISIKIESNDHEKLKHLSNCRSYRNAEMQLFKSVLAKTADLNEAARLLGLDDSTFKEKIEHLQLSVSATTTSPVNN
jgi:DNA-binding NtrC family response regulator